MRLLFLRKLQTSVKFCKWVYDLRMMDINGFMRFTAASVLLIGLILAILTIEIL